MFRFGKKKDKKAETKTEKKDLKIRSGLEGKVFLVIIILSFAGILILIKPYLSAIIIGFIAALLAQPLYNFFGKKTKFGPAMKTVLVSLVFLLIIIIPIVILVTSIVNEVPQFLELIDDDVNKETIEQEINKALTSIEEIDPDGPVGKALDSVLSQLSNIIATVVASFGQWLTGFLTGLVSSLIPFFTNLVIFIFVFISLLPNLEKTFKYLDKISPFDKDITNLFINRISVTTKNMILASVAVAVISGLIVCIMFIIFGLPFVGIATMLAIMFGFIPLLGPSFVTIPTAIILALNDQWGPAIIFVLVQIFIIGQVDLMVRPFFQTEDTKIHPVIMGIAVLGGIAAFGILGIIYGPLIVIIFMTCLQIYMESYERVEEEEK